MPYFPGFQPLGHHPSQSPRYPASCPDFPPRRAFAHSRPDTLAPLASILATSLSILPSLSLPPCQSTRAIYINPYGILSPEPFPFPPISILARLSLDTNKGLPLFNCHKNCDNCGEFPYSPRGYPGLRISAWGVKPCTPPIQSLPLNLAFRELQRDVRNAEVWYAIPEIGGNRIRNYFQGETGG